MTALEPVMREAGGAWIGWSGDAGLEPGPFEADGLHLVGIGLSETEVRDYVPPELVVRPGPVVRQQPGLLVSRSPGGHAKPVIAVLRIRHRRWWWSDGWVVYRHALLVEG